MSGVLHGVLAAIAGARDTFFRYVALLLNTTSTNGAQNNTFLDDSTNAFSITRNGGNPGMTQGTFSPFSQTGWSNYFDGTGDYLSNAYNAVFDFGTGDFTVECWVYIAGNSTADVDSNRGVNLINSFGASAVVGWNFGLIGNTTTTGTGILFDYWNPITSLNGTINRATVTVPQNQWNHVAATRSSGTLRIFLNGTSQTISTSNIGTAYSEANASTNGMKVGASINTSYPGALNGYISNARIVKGTAVYTANFTPPTSPLTDITNTSLLTCQSNRFIDNSSNAFAITRNADVSVQAFSPFNPTAAWSASTNGGSGYFDGTGDDLQLTNAAALSPGTGDFTFECWAYPQGSIANINFFTGFQSGLSVGTDASGNLIYGDAYVANVITTTTPLPVNTWVHIAVARSGTTNSLYLNGTRIGTATSAADLTTGTANYIGSNGNTAGRIYYTGYISNLRLVKGTAVYDPTQTTLTVPTAPLTAITNTSLLLNFTNAGIYDSASGNDLETVGGAQVSTTQAKWGTTSMAFDGTGDWLTALDRPALRFGTGPFTIECWLYLGATGAARGIIGKGTASTGWLLSTDASNKVVFTYTTSTITSTAALSGSTWYHIAVVREGTGSNQTKIYIDGTNDGTGTVSTDFNQTSVMYIGANRTGGDALNGYIDDLRITNGYARYTANFTPPTAAFPLN